jgi:NitT/TauT family transport system substrate-binding protein
MIVRIGHLSTFYHTALLLMAHGGVPARLGAEVEWRLLGTGPAIMQAFERGELDLAYIGLPPAIIGIARGVDVVCVAGGHVEGTVLAGRSRWRGFPELDDLGAVLRQFAGLKIGVPGTGSIHDVILKDCLERHGLAGTVEVVNYPWADLVTEAVARDEVAAAFGTPALAVAIRSFAGGRILYPPSRLWPGNPSCGIVVTRAFLGEHRALVERFLEVHEEATAAFRAEPAAAARDIAAHVGIVDESFVLETLQVSPRYCAQLTGEYVAATLAFAAALRRLGYVGRDVAEHEIFDRSLIDTVHPEPDHYRHSHG